MADQPNDAEPVTSCYGCAFCWAGECNPPDGVDRAAKYGVLTTGTFTDGGVMASWAGHGAPPADCPLRKGTIVVRLWAGQAAESEGRR